MGTAYSSVWEDGLFWHGVCTPHPRVDQSSEKEAVMRKLLWSGSVLALALSLSSAGVLYGQDPKSPNDQSQAQTGDRNPAQPQQKSFTGVIVKDGNRLVLQDPSSKSRYKVDDEAKVQDYVGKQVKIIGSLDASTNILHVESIELVS
jgi:hypothetical protein